MDVVLPPSEVARANAGESPQRARIRDISASLFASRGYNSVGINELCESVGLAKGALYYHIGSKEELLYDIIKRYIDDLVFTGEQIAQIHKDPVARIHALSRYLMRIIGEHINEMTVCFREVNSLTGEKHCVVSSQHTKYQALWADAVREGEKLGVFRPVPTVALKGLLGMYFYSFLWLDPQGKHTPEEIADIFAGLVLRAIAIEPVAAVQKSSRSQRKKVAV